MMATHADFRSFVEACISLTLLVAVHAAPLEVCDKTKCLGPLKHYQGLGCTPVYTNPGDCCAERFDCSHLKELSKDKCYVNGHEYNIGDALSEEDRNPCDVQCTCMKNDDDIATFVCASLDCTCQGLQPNCYYRSSLDQSCAGPQICLKESEERPTCEGDGQLYDDGDFFIPESDPEKICICMPGYKGETVEPFCKKLNRDYCTPLFNDPGNIYKNCLPVFFYHQVPQTECNFVSRCQHDNDTVIHNHDSTKSPPKIDEDDMCRFGNMAMRRGDELNQETDYPFVCLKCVCEVPPLPTCQHILFNFTEPIESSIQNFINKQLLSQIS